MLHGGEIGVRWTKPGRAPHNAVLCCVLAALALLPTTAAAEKVTIHYLNWGVDAEVLSEYAKREFERLHPDIEVHLEVNPNKSIPDIILTRTAAGVAPDVVTVSISDFARLVRTGAFLNLTPLIQGDKELLATLSDFWPGSYKYAELKGNLYGWPRFYMQSAILFYNRDMFTKPGIPLPDERWTWGDLLTAAKRLQTDRTFGIDMGLDSTSITWWSAVNGGGIVDNYYIPTRATLTEPATVEALEFATHLFTTHAVVGNGFAKGLVAMHPGYWGEAVGLLKGGFSEWDIAPLPEGPSARGNAARAIASSVHAISRLTKHPNEALAFARFMSSPHMVAYVTAKGYGIPPRKSVVTKDWLDALGKKNNKAALYGLSNAVPQTPLTPAWADVAGLLNDGLTNARQGKIAVRTLLEQLQPVVDKLIKSSAAD